MPSTTFKCPNCGGGLVFSPDKQMFECEYCMSTFDEQTLVELSRQQEQAAEQPQAEESSLVEDGSGALVYVCRSCGGEIVTDATTAATFCHYCHNPVVLSGRLVDKFKPDSVIPFQITRDEAVGSFKKWIGTKHFVPRDFFNEEQISKICGVYYPYWKSDYNLNSMFSGEGEIITHSSTASHNITSTQHYEVTRSADVAITNVMRSALKKADRLLADGVQPFDFSAAKPFSMGYLSGFSAEKRDVEYAEISAGVDEEVKGYVEPLITAKTKYDKLDGETVSQIVGRTGSYILLPSWVLTYKGKDSRLYYYALNGQSGKVCGVLPIDMPKLYKFALGIAGALFAVLMLGGYFIW